MTIELQLNSSFSTTAFKNITYVVSKPDDIREYLINGQYDSPYHAN